MAASPGLTAMYRGGDPGRVRATPKSASSRTQLSTSILQPAERLHQGSTSNASSGRVVQIAKNPGAQRATAPACETVHRRPTARPLTRTRRRSRAVR